MDWEERPTFSAQEKLLWYQPCYAVEGKQRASFKQILVDVDKKKANISWQKKANIRHFDPKKKQILGIDQKKETNIRPEMGSFIHFCYNVRFDIWRGWVYS